MATRAPKLQTVEDALNDLQPQLAKLRQPFPAHQISKLPKPYKRDSAKGKCAECGGYHGLPAVHLDYVGHAALTDRLLDTDLEWSWEPVGFTPEGLPALDRNGGLWIKLTVCGVTRYGYGAADGKSGGDAMKEMIGDALRNAAMRFGAALDLWHKGDLHAVEDDAHPAHDERLPEDKGRGEGEMSSSALRASLRLLVHHINGCGSVADLEDVLDTEDAKEVIDNCQRRFPAWWETGENMPAEFVPLKKLIEQTRTGLAQLEAAE
jgi:hypothetical protein